MSNLANFSTFKDYQTQVSTRPAGIELRMPWLGRKRGYLLDWLTQRLVQITGRRINLSSAPWLNGPIGDTRMIDREYFANLARSLKLEVWSGDTSGGLIESFRALNGPKCDASKADSAIVDFYERTTNYQHLDVWAKWHGFFRPFGWMLAVIFNRRLNQLNVPLSPVEASKGIESKVVRLVDLPTGEVRFTGWVRELVGTGRVNYIADYSTCRIPGFPGTCLRVVFPLPNGNATVVLSPELQEDGSLLLRSVGRRFGDPGLYFVVRGTGDTVWARYVRALQEVIHVYRDPSGELHADHVFWLLGIRFMWLHYRLLRGGE